MYMEGKAATWIQPYVENYLEKTDAASMKPDTRKSVANWGSFKEEVFGEVDAENQAEKAITRLRQTKSVSAYTAEFKQLQSRIDWDDAALRTMFESGLKDTIKDGLVHHDKPSNLHTLIELATRIDNRLLAAKEPSTDSPRQHQEAQTTGKIRQERGRDHDG
jgi:hypothetical protein